MNQPTAITVTNYMGKRVNPYQMSNVTPMMGMSNFESFHEYEKNNPEYPCPSIANTEPGKTVMAELRWQSPKEALTEAEQLEYSAKHGQIWVPIVEQKEGEGKFGEWVSKEAVLKILEEWRIRSVQSKSHAGDYAENALYYIIQEVEELPSPPITDK